jgi:hypothetical protein
VSYSGRDCPLMPQRCRGADQVEARKRVRAGRDEELGEERGNPKAARNRRELFTGRVPQLGSKSGILNPAGVLPPDSAQSSGIATVPQTCAVTQRDAGSVRAQWVGYCTGFPRAVSRH